MLQILNLIMKSLSVISIFLFLFLDLFLELLRNVVYFVK
jgi:hypothetical protein